MTTLWPDPPAPGAENAQASASDWPDPPAESGEDMAARLDRQAQTMDWGAQRQQAQEGLRTQANQARREATQAWYNRPITNLDAFGQNYNDIFTFGNQPRTVALAQAGANALREGSTRDFVQDYRETLALARDRLQRAREERQAASLGGQLVGGVGSLTLSPVRAAASLKWVPGIGGALNRAAAGRGLGATAAQATIGAGAGALFGGAYGASASEENPEAIREGALQSAGMGAAFGGILPPVARTFGAREAWQRLLGGAILGTGIGGAGGAILNPEDPWGGARLGATIGGLGGAGLAGAGRPAAVSSGRWIGRQAQTAGVYLNDLMRQGAARMGLQTNALIGGPPGIPGGGGQWPRRAQTTDTISTLLNRGVTPRHLEERASLAEATGRNPLAAQVLGEAGLQRGQTLAGLPGRTPQLAADVISERREGQLKRLVEALNEAAQTPQTKMQAGRVLEDEFERISATHYDPIMFDAQGAPRVIAPEAAQRIEGVLTRFPQEILDATSRSMQRIAQMRGEAPPRPGEARYYHKFYSALGQTIRSLERNPSAIENRLFGPEDIAAMKTLRRNGMRPAMDEGIAGYQNARQEWAGLSDAEEALDWGAGILARGRNAPSAEQVAAEFKALSPFERDFARIGLRDDMRRAMAERAREGVRKRNIADLFSDTETRDKIRAVFGDKADRFIKQMLSEDLEFNELGSLVPRAGAKTAPMFADVMDQMATQGGAQGFMNQAGNWIWRTAMSPLFEAQRNRTGQALLQELSPTQIRELRRLLRARLSRQQFQRLKRGKEAGEQGAIGAVLPSEEAAQ